MDLRDIPKPKIRWPPGPPDLDAEPPRRERPECLRVGGVVPGVHREERPASDPGLQAIPDPAEGLRLPPMPGRDEIPVLLARQDRERRPGGHALDPPVEGRPPGRIEPPIVHGQSEPLRFQVGPGELRDDPVEDSRRGANPPPHERGLGVPEPEAGRADLEPVAPAVQDSPKAHPASEIRKGPAREDRQADAGGGRQTRQRPSDRRGEPGGLGPIDDRRERAVEVENQEKARSRLELGPESSLEGAEAPGVRRDVAQRSLAPRSPTGKRDSSLSKWPAQR